MVSKSCERERERSQGAKGRLDLATTVVIILLSYDNTDMLLFFLLDDVENSFLYMLVQI